MSITLNIQLSDFNESLLYSRLCRFVSSCGCWKQETGNSTFRRALCFLLCEIICHMVFRFMLYLCAPCPRLLKDQPEFVFIPRSRQELPANFPEDIPGVCYFLEASFKTSKLTLKWGQAVAEPPQKMIDAHQVNTVQTPCIFAFGCLDIDDIVNQSNSSSSLITQLSNMSLVSVKLYICTIEVERIFLFFFLQKNRSIAAPGLLWKKLNMSW